ncbi:MAG: hypothetical protein CR997_14085 [Acidobacteria bacterium]|nr:MAG: hypothetical protein CR997_14085 [Acidobacteriota bacterium]
MLDLELGASSFQSVNISRGNLLDLVVDNLHNRLYWTNENPASIQRSDLSLQNIETLVTQFKKKLRKGTLEHKILFFILFLTIPNDLL